MIAVKVGATEQSWRRPEDIDRGWVRDRFQQLDSSNDGVCVRIRIEAGDDVNLAFATPGCIRGEGGSRAYTPREARMAALWRAQGLHQRGFGVDQVQVFLRDLADLL